MHDLDRTYLEDTEGLELAAEGEGEGEGDGYGENESDSFVACHSGGGSTMRAIATGGGTYARRIRECWGFDCLYSDGDVEAWETWARASSDGDVEAWETWARASPDARLYVHYTLTAGTAKRSERLRDKGLPNVVIPTPPHQDHHCDVPTTYWQRRIQAALRSAATS